MSVFATGHSAASFCVKQPRLLRDQAIARVGLDHLVAVLAADDDAPGPRRARIEIILAVSPRSARASFQMFCGCGVVAIAQLDDTAWTVERTISGIT